MNRNWLKFAAALVMGAFIFTACEEDGEEVDATLTVPAAASIDLGAEFDAMAGVEVEPVVDVTYTSTPTFSNTLVDEYIFTYKAGSAEEDRSVKVKADLLGGTYEVVDQEDGGDTYTYDQVVAATNTFNQLTIANFIGWNSPGTVVINGANVQVNEFTPDGWDANESISATGAYDGAEKNILTMDYVIKEDVDGAIVETTGKMTFTRK